MTKRKTPQDYHTLAHKRGFRWLGPEVPNVRTKTGWECERGHKFKTSYRRIQRVGRCRNCSLGVKGTSDYHALAQKRGFRWVGPEVPNTNTKTGWECSKGHEWEAIYKTIYNGSGCPHCSGLKRKKPADYHALAHKRGFKWLGPEVPNVRTKTRWECERGHEWEAIYKTIRKGHGCLLCYRARLRNP